jgi:hypothetical protein
MSFAFVDIKTKLNFEELVAVLSGELCGGIPLGGLEESIRDEVPAVFTLKTFLGICVVLYGGDGDYSIQLFGDDDYSPNSEF